MCGVSEGDHDAKISWQRIQISSVLYLLLLDQGLFFCSY
jgi:hypothetical protein